jgi:hypothetical protein
VKTDNVRGQADPLDSLLAAAAVRAADPVVRRWLARLAADRDGADGSAPTVTITLPNPEVRQTTNRAA